MDPRYRIESTRDIFSPAFVVFREALESNLDKMIALAGRPERLRPHCKTHKMPQIIKILLQRGVSKHKCATLAEAEMLAQAGVEDVFLAYNLVGPNIARTVEFVAKYPKARLSVTADHPQPVA